MIDPIYKLTLDANKLEEMLRGMIEARMDTLPDPLRSAAWQMSCALSSAEINERIADIRSLGIDWSRAGPTVSGWNASYCDCIFCGQQVANKKGIEDHLHRSQCPVLGAIIKMARVDYCKTEYWEREMAEKRKIEAARAKSLILVDIDRGSEEFHRSYDARKDLAAIEPRLADLGFTKTVLKLSGGRSETRWEMITEKARVLADPREEGRIYIRAWPLDAKPGARRKRRFFTSSEYILDGWRHDLGAKLNARIEKLLAAREAG